MDEEKKQANKETIKKVYGTEEEGEYAQKLIQQINQDLELREKQSYIFNGVSYSQSYEYNQKKAINYAPPRNTNDDREVTMGLVHEKIISFAAIFLKYVFKKRIKCYDEKGQLVRGMGKVYELAIEFSQKLELFKKKLALIYWETFTQGDCFILEDWEVKMRENPKAYKMGEEGKVLVNADSMDYTYEFLDGLTYEKGEPIQYRRAVSRILDGRCVILGNPETEDLQEQPRTTLEEEVVKGDAEAMFGTLKRWTSVPSDYTNINNIIGMEKSTLFDATRFKDPAATYLIHRVFDKEYNKFNIFVNGVMMLPRETPLTIFYPRGNYPISQVCAERVKGSAYSRSIPAKTKFNADFVDWALKMLANKFEQGVDPAILTKGKYTLTRDMFRGGQVTHGVSRSDYEKADPENKGVTQPEFSFVQLLKEIIESQTVNPTTAGELSANATATEISVVENNQRDKLGYLLDGLMNGFMDMTLRRAETIESKYTIKQKETIVDGKKVSVYQNFTVNVAGVENVVAFDESVGTEGYDEEMKRDELFTKAFKERKRGYPTEYFLVNPIMLREKRWNLDVEILPERIKDTQLQLIQMWDDFDKLLTIFQGQVNNEELKKEYLEISGKPDEIFTTRMYQQLEQQTETPSYNMGSYAKPTIKNAQRMERNIKQ